MNDWLEEFGRQLWASGRAYWRYSELINAISARRGELRRGLGRAWDLAYAWKEREPGQHHLAMPTVIIQAMIVGSCLWGWPRLAGCLALGWGAMLRPMEWLVALRADLVLPRDVLHTVPFALLRIAEPKTRNTGGARHQTGRIDDESVVGFLDAIFGELPPTAALWPASAGAFRRRFQAVLQQLRLPTRRTSEQPVLDLGSIRAGAATTFYQVTEDAERLRIRGRWVNGKMMSIYLQELVATTYLSKLAGFTREHIHGLALALPAVARNVAQLLRSQVPAAAWPAHCRQQL